MEIGEPKSLQEGWERQSSACAFLTAGYGQHGKLGVVLAGLVTAGTGVNNRGWTLHVVLARDEASDCNGGVSLFTGLLEDKS